MNHGHAWAALLGIAGFGTLVVGFVSDAAERRGSRDVELGGQRYRCASLMQRYMAHFVDGAILLGVFLLPGWVRSPAGGASVPWGAGVAAAAFALAYFVGCEACWGQTPGKRLVRIRVAGRDGLHPPWRAAFVRNLARVADTFFAAYLVGVWAWLRSPERQRIGDRIADTWVVSDAILVDEPEHIRAARAVECGAPAQGLSPRDG